MSKELCTYCAGTREVQRLSDPYNMDSAAYELVDCPSCGGTGFQREPRRVIIDKTKGPRQAERGPTTSEIAAEFMRSPVWLNFIESKKRRA